MLESCKHSGQMLLTLVNDLLDLAKQDAMTFQFNQCFFNLLKTIKNTFATLEFLAEQRNVTLSLGVSKTDSDFFQNIYGDQNRYEQILLNLISNAIKFTKNGTQVKVVLEI